MEGLKRTATWQTNKKGWHNSQTTQHNLLTLICMFQRNTNMLGWSFLDLQSFWNISSFETFTSVCSVLKIQSYILANIFQDYKSRLEQGLLGQWSIIEVTILPWDINIPLQMFFMKKCKIQLRYFHCCVNI